MHIHHVNILVHDLEQAVPRYERLLGQPPAAREILAARGVATARFPLGGAWLVLVQPLRADSVPGRHLARHGEGLFLLSLGVASLQAEEARLGAEAFSGPVRQGVDGWCVRDLGASLAGGAQLQFTQQGQAVREGEVSPDRGSGSGDPPG